MKKVLLTGASSGIGKAIAEKLASEGLQVLAGVRKLEDKKAVEEINPNITGVILDVTDNNSIDTLFESLESDGIELCGIINNAGIAVANILEYADINAIKEQFNVNTFAPLKITTKFLPLMSEGKIINISSISSHVVFPFISPYCASKKAMDTLFQAFDIELKNPKIKIVSIKASSIKSPIWNKSIDKTLEYLENIPSKKISKYETRINKIINSCKKNNDKALDPKLITDLVYKVIKNKNPKHSYNVGLDAHLGEWISKLPINIQQLILKRCL